MAAVPKLGAVLMMAISLMLARCTGSLSSSPTSARTIAGTHATAQFQVRVTPTAVAGADGYFWLAGTYPCATGKCSVLMRSSDGGVTWVRVESPFGPLVAEPSLMFANGSDGYAYGTDANVLFWTRDGGLTWQRVQLGDPLAAPITTAGGRAYALTYGCPRRKGEVCLSVDLASSPVDRNDWTQARNRFVFKLTSDAQSVSIAAFGAKVWFVLASEGRCPSCGVSVSQNYGRTFSALPREQFWGWWGTTTTATSDQTLWLTAYGVHNSANLRSTDGGKRFVSIPAGNSFSNPFSSLIPLSDQEAVLFFYSAYSRWSVRVTTDGGQRFKTVFGPTNAVNAIAVANSKDWLVSGDSVLWRTTNGGVAWQSIEPPRV